MEDFSQSRGDDDLFDDEIVPIEDDQPTEQIAHQLDQVSLEPEFVPPPIETIAAAVPAPAAATAPSSTKTSTSAEPPFPTFRPRPPRGRGGNVAGQARETRKASGLEESKWAVKLTESKIRTTKDANTPTQPPAPVQPAAPQTDVPPAETSTPTVEATEELPTPTTAASTVPTGPSQTTAAVTKVPAVRGDRTLTGGAPRSKLTEEQLSAKLAEAKERSQNVAAAHARAQADAASFEERERQAHAKRAVEKVERRKMEGERERNRLRKLGGREGREWDRDKEEVAAMGNGQHARGAGPRRGYGYRAGDEESGDLSMYEWNDDRGRGRGRGRGGRGGRGRGSGRGGQRGGFGVGDGQDGHQHHQQPDVSAETDFPALPGSGSATTHAQPSANAQPTTSASASETTKPSPQRWDSTGGGGGTWADQVESSDLNTVNPSKR